MEALQAVLTGFAVVGAWLSALLAWRSGARATVQREVQGKREEWWRRFQWSTELALDERENRAQSGAALLRVIRRSPLAEYPERDAVRAVLDSMLGETQADGADSANTEYVLDRTEGDGEPES
ncbi:hypothetical protein [Tomitella biformata]|uniref:hypothetical protein n=1 Tax=Tomitella biformata TaxID=630403 RepID=UPI0011DDD9F0|nr:hypothetical protein [Tomitella biformata]